MEYHKIEYKHYFIHLNLKLLERNGKLDNIPELEKVYIEMYKIFEKMEHTENRITLFYLNQSIEPLELKMQELWGFPQDRNHHRYWHSCPKCSCSEYDNYESMGTEYRHYHPECLIHGEKTRNLINRELKLKRIL